MIDPLPAFSRYTLLEKSPGTVTATKSLFIIPVNVPVFSGLNV